ncbi:MAG: helix-turn-helix transcriptional regulator [Lachnospiraceae bacterium]|nr:helix-turn-helix transcriptional regulator [Lachnospiraceae bacterium]
MTVGDRIRKRRIELGISQTELAERINSSKQTMHKYETNIITNIPTDKIEDIAKILETSPAYLMGWDEFSDEEAFLDMKISKDYELKQAIKKYYKLDNRKKKYVLDLINLLNE